MKHRMLKVRLLCVPRPSDSGYAPVAGANTGACIPADIPTHGDWTPWQLFDNDNDPYQMNNLVGDAAYADTVKHLDGLVDGWLVKVKDDFKPAEKHLADWGYEVDETGTVPYKP